MVVKWQIKWRAPNIDSKHLNTIIKENWNCYINYNMSKHLSKTK